jgi:hypothetical protein
VNPANKVSEYDNNGMRSRDITLEDGRTIQLVQDKSKDTYDNYSHIVINGQKYDVIPGSIRRYRDGGTTYSAFQ